MIKIEKKINSYNITHYRVGRKNVETIVEAESARDAIKIYCKKNKIGNNFYSETSRFQKNNSEIDRDNIHCQYCPRGYEGIAAIHVDCCEDLAEYESRIYREKALKYITANNHKINFEDINACGISGYTKFK